MRHVWLIGMMGTGKTTVGVLVAEQLKRPFIDLDNEIMIATGKTIPELFADGEEVFRRAETAALLEASVQPPSVIATGGGAVLAQQNLDAMAATGVTVLLTASTETIMDRLAQSHTRPLARDAKALEAIAALRTAVYLEAADHAVTTEGKDAASVAREVLACVGM
ncbi:MAG: shikimate kinase [Acidimicrobiia bacterium]